jgi:hypothetical protein
MASTQYQVTITMSQATVDALTENGFILNAFKAVKATVGRGAPLVWSQTRSFTSSTVLTWTDTYQAYTSETAIVPNERIAVGNAYPISLDDTLNVTASSGAGSVMGGGVQQAITIMNQTRDLFTGGISQAEPGGSDAPVCALPLYGDQPAVIAPVEKVLLMFSTMPIQPGTVVEQAPSQGILIDLTDAPARSVAYDINQGWSWDGGNWAEIVGPATNLVPLLIDTSGPSVP